MSPPHQIDIDYAIQSERYPSEENMIQWIGAALADQKQLCVVSLKIVDIEEITWLNKQYRHKPTPTNILSFPLSPHFHLSAECLDASAQILGDLALCGPITEQEALQQNKTIHAHFAHLLIHGTLHLLGYNHEEKEEALVMEALEIKLLKQLGFPNPYIILDTQHHE